MATLFEVGKGNLDLNFIEKSRKYEFTLFDYAYLNDEFVYAIAFKPKRSADFKGVMYINTDDFAIVRVDYENVKPLRKFGLLGISFKERATCSAPPFAPKR